MYLNQEQILHREKDLKKQKKFIINKLSISNCVDQGAIYFNVYYYS